MKTCYKCNIEKEYSEFYKHKNAKDGHCSVCKKCDAIRDKLRIRIDYSRQKNWKEKNPEKYKAHKILQNAVRKNLIIKTECFVCGNNKVEAHHPNYDNPLDIVWLCRTHHRETHKMVLVK